MASLFDNVVDDSKVYKGAGRVVYAATVADGGPAFPEQIEDVIDCESFVLASGWNDFGATTRDGISVTRSLELEDGVETDQLSTAILSGTPKLWKSQMKLTMLHTDLASLALGFESPAAEAVGVGEGTQYKLKVGTPSSLTERQLAVVQRHSALNKYRMVAVRRAMLAPIDLEIALKSEEASQLALTFDMQADTTQETTDNMFQVFEMTAVIS